MPLWEWKKDYESNGYCLVNSGLGIGSESNNPLYKEVLDYYQNINFINIDGSLNLVTVVDYVSNILKKHGLKDVPGIQNIKGIYI